MTATIGTAIRYVVGCGFAAPSESESQPLNEALANEGIALPSMGHVQSWRSVGTPFAPTKIAKSSAAASASDRVSRFEMAPGVFAEPVRTAIGGTPSQPRMRRQRRLHMPQSQTA